MIRAAAGAPLPRDSDRRSWVRHAYQDDMFCHVVCLERNVLYDSVDERMIPFADLGVFTVLYPNLGRFMVCVGRFRNVFVYNHWTREEYCIARDEGPYQWLPSPVTDRLAGVLLCGRRSVGVFAGGRGPPSLVPLGGEVRRVAAAFADQIVVEEGRAGRQDFTIVRATPDGRVARFRPLCPPVRPDEPFPASPPARALAVAVVADVLGGCSLCFFHSFSVPSRALKFVALDREMRPVGPVVNLGVTWDEAWRDETTTYAVTPVGQVVFSFLSGGAPRLRVANLLTREVRESRRPLLLAAEGGSRQGPLAVSPTFDGADPSDVLVVYRGGEAYRTFRCPEFASGKSLYIYVFSGGRRFLVDSGPRQAVYEVHWWPKSRQSFPDVGRLWALLWALGAARAAKIVVEGI